MKCSICFDEFSHTHFPVSLKCGHVFGNKCLTTWYTKAKLCPVCKTSFRMQTVRKLYIDYEESSQLNQSSCIEMFTKPLQFRIKQQEKEINMLSIANNTLQRKLSNSEMNLKDFKRKSESLIENKDINSNILGSSRFSYSYEPLQEYEIGQFNARNIVCVDASMYIIGNSNSISQNHEILRVDIERCKLIKTFSLDSDIIADTKIVKFDSISNYQSMASCSLSGYVHITSLKEARVVKRWDELNCFISIYFRFYCGYPVWSCMKSLISEYCIDVGLDNSKVKQYDLRYLKSSVCEFFLNKHNRIPIHSMHHTTMDQKEKVYCYGDLNGLKIISSFGNKRNSLDCQNCISIAVDANYPHFITSAHDDLLKLNSYYLGKLKRVKDNRNIGFNIKYKSIFSQYPHVIYNKIYSKHFGNKYLIDVYILNAHDNEVNVYDANFSPIENLLLTETPISITSLNVNMGFEKEKIIILTSKRARIYNVLCKYNV
ncbi:hypothetical protein A3Q56_02546 [Intoshia linei]|uniref:RING-type domain-containing protein n=1 Tax=Intoshia linei TaxID=1819745 RepID=A0A177B7T7_9BILA|nr:hypothetical protein A3Q56_02546 [Intoshia linei]